MKKKKLDEEQELKLFVKQLNQINKVHLEMKHLVSSASHDLALLKAINKHEKKTRTRPEEVYMINIRKRVEKTLGRLGEIYSYLPHKFESNTTTKPEKVQKIQVYPKASDLVNEQFNEQNEKK